jgi:cytochrome P450
MLLFARRIARSGTVLPGSLGEEVLLAAKAGKLDRHEVPALMIDYLAPSLDTTISAIASALHLFATHPEQWAALRADPALIPNAANEVIRFETPIRAFSRRAAVDTDVAGTAIPRGARVLVLYASANRDELVWDQPDVFDIGRDAGRQLAFGYGSHGCAGQGLARMESEAMLTALVERVERIEVAGVPVWARNNLIRCRATLPLTLVPVSPPEPAAESGRSRA